MKQNIYHWTKKDKMYYIISMIPFVVLFIGTGILLGKGSIILPIILFCLYITMNIFQAGCCVGCPYQGKYCPAIMGVYLGNVFSGIFYKNRKSNERFFKINETGAGISLFLFVTFPLYWLYKAGWYYLLIYFMLLAVHYVLFMPTQCEHCSYNTTCPGGKSWLKCREILRKKQ